MKSWLEQTWLEQDWLKMNGLDLAWTETNSSTTSYTDQYTTRRKSYMRAIYTPNNHGHMTQSNQWETRHMTKATNENMTHEPNNQSEHDTRQEYIKARKAIHQTAWIKLQNKRHESKNMNQTPKTRRDIIICSARMYMHIYHLHWLCCWTCASFWTACVYRCVRAACCSRLRFMWFTLTVLTVLCVALQMMGVIRQARLIMFYKENAWWLIQSDL